MLALEVLSNLCHVLLSLTLASAANYDGHKVLRLLPEADHHVTWLHEHAAGPSDLQLDFWTEPTVVRRSVDVQVSPDREQQLLSALSKLQLKYETIIHDVQHLVDTQGVHNSWVKTQRKREQYDFDHYLNLDEMMDWLEGKVIECGSRCDLITIGQSFQGRDLKVLKISSGLGRRGVWIDAGLHSREWISHAVALYIIERLIDDYDGTDSFVRDLLHTYDVYIMPAVNVDGYVYSHNADRLWRKTMSTVDEYCVGVDPNRNFDFNWMTVGASANPCSNTYGGPKPFSEPEAKAMADFIMARNGSWEVYLTLHSYSQLWMAPWGFTDERPDDYNELMRVGTAAVNSLREVYGAQFKVGTASEILYGSSGTSRDWAKGVPQIPYVYTVELRDTGFFGFVLPPYYIRPSAEETWSAVRAMMTAISQR